MTFYFKKVINFWSNSSFLVIWVTWPILQLKTFKAHGDSLNGLTAALKVSQWTAFCHCRPTIHNGVKVFLIFFCNHGILIHLLNRKSRNIILWNCTYRSIELVMRLHIGFGSISCCKQARDYWISWQKELGFCVLCILQALSSLSNGPSGLSAKRIWPKCVYVTLLFYQIEPKKNKPFVVLPSSIARDS